MENERAHPNPITDILFWEFKGASGKRNYRKLLNKESKCTAYELYELILDRNQWELQIKKLPKMESTNDYFKYLEKSTKNQQIQLTLLLQLLLLLKKLSRTSLLLLNPRPQQRK